MEARDIILRPVITERTTAHMAEGKYTFVVDKRANKIQIAQAVEEIFKVKVAQVNTMNLHGKPKRMGRTQGHRPSQKRAIVKLAAGESIEFFTA